MNRTLLHRINALESEMDAEHDMLAQCAASGQMDARQIVEHKRAGELPIGDKHAGIVGSAMDLRPLAVQPVSSDLGVESALPPSFTAAAPKPARRWQPDPQAIAIGVALAAIWTLILVVKNLDRFGEIWPLFVAGLSF